MFAEDVVDVDDGSGVTDLGVKGVMEHSPAIELLYKLIARWNLIIVVVDATAFEITQSIMVISSSSNLERVKHDDSKNRVRLVAKSLLSILLFHTAVQHTTTADSKRNWHCNGTFEILDSGQPPARWAKDGSLGGDRSKTVTDAGPKEPFRCFVAKSWLDLIEQFSFSL